MRNYFRREGRCDRYPGVHGKQKSLAAIRKEGNPSTILMGFLEKLDADIVKLTNRRRPNRKKYLGRAYEDVCRAVYDCLKAGSCWRTEDLRYLNHFDHPLYLLSDFVEDSGCSVNEETLRRLMRTIRCGKVDIGKYRLDESRFMAS